MSTPEPVEPLTSTSGNVSAFIGMYGYIVLTDDQGRDVVLTLTKDEGIELMEWLSRATA